MLSDLDLGQFGFFLDGPAEVCRDCCGGSGGLEWFWEFFWEFSFHGFIKFGFEIPIGVECGLGLGRLLRSLERSRRFMILIKLEEILELEGFEGLLFIGSIQYDKLLNHSH